LCYGSAMPTRGPFPRDFTLQIRAYLGAIRKPGRKRPKRRGGEGEPVPVAPDKPNMLSGGAAAALEFDE
jgi:hypothetical protein